MAATLCLAPVYQPIILSRACSTARVSQTCSYIIPMTHLNICTSICKHLIHARVLIHRSKATHKNSICHWSAIIPSNAPAARSASLPVPHHTHIHRMGQLKTSKTSHTTCSICRLTVFVATARLKSALMASRILCFISAASNLLVATCPEHTSQTDFARRTSPHVDRRNIYSNKYAHIRHRGTRNPDQLHSPG